MDIYDIRALKSYLDNCLEPMLKDGVNNADKWAREAKKAEESGAVFDADLAHKMRRWHEGRVSAYTAVINDFKEVFADQLKERD